MNLRDVDEFVNLRKQTIIKGGGTQVEGEAQNATQSKMITPLRLPCPLGLLEGEGDDLSDRGRITEEHG
jgi:hypothetical protein